MFADIFSDLIGMLMQVVKAIAAAVSILLSIVVALSVYKKYKIAQFTLDPNVSDKFNKWHAINGDNYDNLQDSAKDYIEQVRLASEFKYLHRREAARERFYERRDAYRYMKAMDRYKLEDDNQTDIKESHITYDNGSQSNDYYDDGYWASVEDDYYR